VRNYDNKLSQKLLKISKNSVNLFLESIKSEQTRRVYIVYLNKWMEYLGAKKNFAGLDPRKIEQSIIDYIILLKKIKKYSAVQNYVSPILAFYKINDVVLNTNKIQRFMPDKRKSNKDRSYTHEEIHRLLNAADERMRAVILLLSSSGVRVGAIPNLRLRNIEKIEINTEAIIYKITVYEGNKEEYFTFTTPECSAAIDNYLAMRSRYGEKLLPNSFLIREQFDIRDPFAISKPVKIGTALTLSNKIIDLGIRCGLRKKQVLTESTKYLGSSFRKDVPIAHGSRKFFTTQLINSKVNPEIREMLLGHKIGLAAAYYKPTDDDFVIEYEKAINNLTINEEYRLKMKVKKLEIEKSQLEQLAADVAILKRKWKIRKGK
jgi:integrase